MSDISLCYLLTRDVLPYSLHPILSARAPSPVASLVFNRVAASLQLRKYAIFPHEMQGAK